VPHALTNACCQRSRAQRAKAHRTDDVQRSVHAYVRKCKRSEPIVSICMLLHCTMIHNLCAALLLHTALLHVLSTLTGYRSEPQAVATSDRDCCNIHVLCCRTHYELEHMCGSSTARVNSARRQPTSLKRTCAY
jgi:hypothetical protein